MQFPRLLVLGYAEASMFLRNGARDAVRALIAIHGEREDTVEVGRIPHHLILQFDDIDVPDEHDLLQQARLHVRRREAAEYGLSPSPPTIEHAARIIEFARGIRELDGVLLCQCQAGVSRSAAAALLCLATWTYPGEEQECFEYLMSIRPCALPHRGLVAFGDHILGRSGGLLRCIS